MNPFGDSLLELETAIVIDQELGWAKLRMEDGRKREAANAIFMAHDEYGASQQLIAAAVGKSQSWVCGMLRWRRDGFKDATPFGPSSKEGRRRAVIKRHMRPRMARQRWIGL
jgi:hypothetical protein